MQNPRTILLFAWAELVLCTLLLGLPQPSHGWQRLESGLDFAEFALAGQDKAIAVLRIDATKFHFVLCSADTPKMARTLPEWARQYDLLAAINASMYLKDGKTSTGYLRHKDLVNNPRFHQGFGAFFVANPKNQALPQAAILERDEPDLFRKLDQYELVVQNFRLITRQGRIPWPKTGPAHPIACVAMDHNGNVLFILCKIAVQAHTLASKLLQLPLMVSSAMYVEGGFEAELFVKGLDAKEQEALFPLLTIHSKLPNVLGVRP
ncbi:MAG: phosphodiester glycosidase family protein [Desulfovibrio sp.]|nr:phosphodiester glycosidase family protein [Desulfovibrio sp.]